MEYIYSSLIGYVLGCIQPSYILTRIIKKTDIRSIGSGNAGASNTVGALGWKYGVFVAVFDILKAVAAVLIVRLLFRDIPDGTMYTVLQFTAGFFVIIGHNHPIYMRFKGGKGTASLIGMLAAIDIRIALICAAVIILITILTDYIALGALGMVAAAAIFTAVFGYSIACVVIMILIALLSFVNHIANIKRIIEGTENGLRKTIRKN